MLKRMMIALIASAGLSKFALAEDPVMPELNGAWESIACELRPQADPGGVKDWYLKRQVRFEGNTIYAHFTTYADAACNMPLTEIKFSGDVLVKGDSGVAEGAKDVDLIINKAMAFQPRMQGFADFLN